MKKIRGHRKIWKRIAQWILRNREIDIDRLRSRGREYVKISIYPWNGFSRTKTVLPEPNKQTKQRLLDGLIEIYESWKMELDKSGESYYLKIWLYEERFSRSQVVCAIGDSIHFYDHAFFKPWIHKEMNADHFGNVKKLAHFQWELRLDEDIYDSTSVGRQEEYASESEYLESKKWIENLLTKKHRKYIPANPTRDYFEIYAFEKGKVWLGEQNKSSLQ